MSEPQRDGVSVCVFCGSRSGNRPEYAEAARNLAAAMIERGVELVYGAGSVGLMGVIADEMLARGGRVVGVIPEHLCRKEVLHENLSELHVTSSLLERKLLMMELSQGFIALPGGLGTFDEILEVHTWAQLGRHQKPLGLVNRQGYFDPFIQLLDHSVAEGFLDSVGRGMLMVAPEPVRLLSDLLQRLKG